MKYCILFLHLVIFSDFCVAQSNYKTYFEKIDSILNYNLIKLYSPDRIKIIRDTDDVRKSLNKEFNTTIFYHSTIINSYHYLISDSINNYLVNDSSNHSQISIIEFQFKDNKSSTKALSLLKSKMGLNQWGTDLMLTCVKKNNNNLIFLYSGYIYNGKISLLLKQFCPNCRCEVIFVPTSK